MSTRRIPATVRPPAIVLPASPVEPMCLTVAAAQIAEISRLRDELEAWRRIALERGAALEATQAALRGARALLEATRQESVARALDSLARAATAMDAGQLGEHLAAQVRAFPVARKAHVIRAYGGDQ